MNAHRYGGSRFGDFPMDRVQDSLADEPAPMVAPNLKKKAKEIFKTQPSEDPAKKAAGNFAFGNIDLDAFEDVFDAKIPYVEPRSTYRRAAAG